MIRAARRLSVRRALAIHALSTLLVAIGVAAVSSALSAALAVDAARESAARVADTVAHAVAAPLAAIDVSSPGPEMRTQALGELQAFFDADVIERVKIWKVEGDEAVVLFSDEARVEGERRPFDAELAARLDAGEVVVLDVPDDWEHRFEIAHGGLVEAFIGFTDAAGSTMRLELYMPSVQPDMLRDMLAVTLPPVIIGPILLGAATLPLALRLARRLDERDAERRALLHTALAASDHERQRLAALLHDGVIQDLASAGLLLERIGSTAHAPDADRAALLTQVSGLLDADLAELRSLLSRLAPPQFEGSLVVALYDLAADLETSRTRIDVQIGSSTSADAEVETLIYRVVRELVRNAVEHAAPASVTIAVDGDGDEVVCRVADDGRGFDPAAPAPDGHFGLRLVRQAITDSGGTIDIVSQAGDTAGTTVTVRLPRRMIASALAG